jgi:hypothetical protein
VLEATTLLEHLVTRHPGAYGPRHLRTLQRRLRDWRAVHGPDRDVVFPQAHVPGREAAVDFTHATDLGVTIAGQPLRHLLFQFVLTYSGWTWLRVCFGETFEALVAGLQGALWTLGGVPEVVRSDNLSAATHELRRTGGRALTTRFAAVLTHYGMRSTRIRPGESQENGAVEQAHRRTKGALAQALVLRGSSDFADVAAYEAFARDVVDRRRNGELGVAYDQDRAALRALPAAPVPAYTTHRALVHRTSTIYVAKRTYSVPSRLIGSTVHVRQHPDLLEVFYRERLVATMPRLLGEGAAHRIDDRHVIWALVRKPGAFARYRYRADLFPSLVFRRAYDALVAHHGDRADVEYVRVLHLAASTMEVQVARALDELLGGGGAFDYAAVRARVRPERAAVPQVQIGAPDLAAYDGLLAGGAA